MTALKAAVAVLVLLAGVVIFLVTWPVMLVLGALHGSGLTAVPALGFWQTLGSLFIISAIGHAFHPIRVRGE